MSFLAQQPSETIEEFNARKVRVYNSYVVSMTINRTNGESMYGNNEQFRNEIEFTRSDKIDIFLDLRCAAIYRYRACEQDRSVS